MSPREIVSKVDSRFGKVGKMVGLFASFIVVAVLVIFVWEVSGTGRQLRGTLPSIGGGSSGGFSGVMQKFNYGFDGDMMVATDESYSMGAPIMYEEAVSRNSVAASSIVPPWPMNPPAATDKIPTSDKKIIKNGSLDFLVQDADSTVAGIENVANKYQGFVENSNVYERTEGIKSGYASLRIPATSFDAAFAELKTFAIKVISENSNTNDVTAQYIDLEAQVKNYKAEELQYQEIMKKATKIDDILNVASRLAEVRSRIERTQGQLNLLSREVDMSTITVSFTAEPVVSPTDVIWRPITVIKEGVKNLLEGLAMFADFLIRVVFYLPILALKLVFVGVVIFLAWRLGLLAYRRLFAPGIK